MLLPWEQGPSKHRIRHPGCASYVLYSCRASDGLELELVQAKDSSRLKQNKNTGVPGIKTPRNTWYSRQPKLSPRTCSTTEQTKSSGAKDEGATAVVLVLHECMACTSHCAGGLSSRRSKLLLQARLVANTAASLVQPSSSALWVPFHDTSHSTHKAQG